MPLIPSYFWEENEKSIYVTVKIRGASLKDIDIYGEVFNATLLQLCIDYFAASDLVLKVNFQPYVLLLDLLHEIHETSLCVKRAVDEDALKITLTKVMEHLYPKTSMCQ
jgi:hypothetical protein